MEFYRNDDINEQHDYFLEEFLGIRSDIDCNIYTTDLEDLINGDINGIWSSCNSNSSLDSFSKFPVIPGAADSTLDTFFDDFALPLITSDHFQQYIPFGDREISPPDFFILQDSSPTNLDHSQTRPPANYTSQHQQYCCCDEKSSNNNNNNGFQNNSDLGPPCKLETLPELMMPSAFHAGSSFYPNSESRKTDKGRKKVNAGGQPSKNLMAERRRRKRLNDRLSMLRSIVPKISKMDRTSIVGDTIDYIKELLERINALEQHDVHLGSSNNQLMSLMSIFQEAKPNELLLRNSPKFEVERRNSNTRVEICCGDKPGLLLSTVTTLEALGLDIHQCVISCFNDFLLQASCSEEWKKRTILDAEDIKQALHRNAGYASQSN